MSDKFIRTGSTIYYLKPLSLPAPKIEPEVTHHIFVIDRSGSMYGDIEGLKDSINQVLAVESLVTPSVETTLISFSSSGDVTLHWANVPVDKVVALDQPYIKVLRSIKATYLTGISQGLNLALDKVKAGQTTGITLFTDGYANDPSPSAENKALDAFVKRAEGMPNVFVNCIGYRDWCDWPRMGSIANALSGKCVKATSFKTVLEAMKDTQALLAGRVRPAIVFDGEKDTRVMVVNRTTGQVNLSRESEGMTLRGMGENDVVEVYRVSKTEASKKPPKSAKALPVDEAYLTGALSLGFVSQGAMRASKEVLFSSGNKTLWNEHQSAMTPSSIAEMVNDLLVWVKAGSNQSYEMGKNTKPQHNLFDLADAVNDLPPKSIGLDLDAFMATYRRRSIQRVPGTRLDDGTVQPPVATTVPREGARTYIRGMSFNRTDASVQLETEKAVWVKRLADGKVFTEIEYVSLDRLRDYRSFTILSSGERNMDILPIEVYTKEAWKALTPFLLPSQSKEFTPGQKAKIALKRFRMEAEEVPSVAELSSTLDRLRAAEAKVKLLSAMVNKGESSPYTEAQVAALRALHLTPSLYFSSPTATHFKDRDEAVRTGAIDSFTRYHINIATPQILSGDEFRSGNAFLDRRYVVKVSGKVVEKPKLDTYLQGAIFETKPSNPKAKDTAADLLMAAVADALLLTANRMTNDEIAKALSDAKAEVEACYKVFQGLVMEIGCTGLLPVELENWATRMEPEQFGAKYSIKLGKDEKEGIYYVFPGDLVIAVTPEVSWYTVKPDPVSSEYEATV